MKRGRTRVGVLGATGVVGQRIVQFLAGHPWFELAALAASERSAGRRYGDAVKWRVSADPPAAAADMIVRPCDADLPCELVFSALDAAVAGPIEQACAAGGLDVVSNSRHHRMEPDVPLLVPEVNPDHLDLVTVQRERRGWQGSIVTNPNCSTIGLVMALAPLHRTFGVDKVVVTTLQALSGAGYPGLASLDAIDNVVPFIAGEEEKMQAEAAKIFGDRREDSISPSAIRISAHCNRVGALDGHLETVSVKLTRPATVEEAGRALAEFRGAVQELSLPSAPVPPILMRTEDDRPQTRLDRDEGRGMTVVVGRLRPCSVLDLRFVVLSHNTIRGAAGAAVLNAELMAARGLLRAAGRERGR